MAIAMISCYLRVNILIAIIFTCYVNAFITKSYTYRYNSILKESSSSVRISRIASTTIKSVSILGDFNYKTDSKLPWIESGYKTWNYNGHKINYIDVGNDDDEDNDKPPLLLIHGFGASVYHWRFNIPVLARKYHVYAIDLLGFGLSDKPIIDYAASIWRDQALEFIDQVIKRPTVVAGNSLGGFTSLYAASMSESSKRDIVRGCILLNAAGRFKNNGPIADDEDEAEWIKIIKAAIQRFVINISFIYTKQPLRIQQVLRQVYPINPMVVDDELVQSIQFPSQDPNAAEVFYRVIAKNGSGPAVCIDDLLKDFSLPLSLIWGTKDPWIRTQAADMIQQLYPSATRYDIDAGHCPHDEDHVAVNAAIDDFMTSLKPMR